MLYLLLLGTYLAGGNVEKGDEIVSAQLELMKLSYFCDDPLYRSKRDATRRSVAQLETSFKIENIIDLDSNLKNNAVKSSAPLNRGGLHRAHLRSAGESGPVVRGAQPLSIHRNGP